LALVHDLAQQIELGREVVEEGAVGDVGPITDLGHGGGLVALLLKARERALEDPAAHLEPPPLAPGRRGFCMDGRLFSHWEKLYSSSKLN